MSNALDLISAVTATVEPVNSTLEDRMREYDLDPKLATIRNGIIVEYRGTVDLGAMDLTKIPFRFVKVTGSFWCHQNRLTSLAGCPKEVSAGFDCSDNKLIGLIGCPKYVYGTFWCTDNKLSSLVGCPEKVGGNFYCESNPGSAGFKRPKGIMGNFYNV